MRVKKNEILTSYNYGWRNKLYTLYIHMFFFRMFLIQRAMYRCMHTELTIFICDPFKYESGGHTISFCVFPDLAYLLIKTHYFEPKLKPDWIFRWARSTAHKYITMAVLAKTCWWISTNIAVTSNDSMNHSTLYYNIIHINFIYRII